MGVTLLIPTPMELRRLNRSCPIPGPNFLGLAGRARCARLTYLRSANSTQHNILRRAAGRCDPCVEMSLFSRSGVPIVSNDRDWDTRLDWHMGPNDTLTGSYLRDDFALCPGLLHKGGALPPFDTQQGGPSQIFRGQWTHIAGTKLVNELAFLLYEYRVFVFAARVVTVRAPWRTPTCFRC